MDDMSKEPLGVSQKFQRTKFDNAYKRKKVKQAYFNGKKTQQDYITSSTLHASRIAAKKKYGETHYTKHIADVDHIIPEKVIYDALKNNPFLSDQDVKEIINIDANYRITSSHLNRKKQAKHNMQIAFDKNMDLSLNARKKLVLDEVHATPQVILKASSITAKNVSEEFIQGSKTSLEEYAIPLMVESVNNLCLVASGEKDFKDACLDMSQFSLKIAAKGGTTQVCKTGLSVILKNVHSSHEDTVFFKNLKNIASSNYVTQILNVSMLIKNSMIKFINGEIDGIEFFEEIGEKGVSLIGSSIGTIMGELLIPIPVVGALLGNFIISTICTSIYKSCINIYRSFNYHKEKLAQVSAFANQALEQMHIQRTYLHSLIESELTQWNMKINSGFDQILTSIINNDANGISSGIDSILTLLNESVKFKTYEEFNDFFMDENSILTL